MAATTVARQAGEGDAFWLLGGLYEVKVSGAESGGALSMIEMHLPAGLGPPPHRHPGDESVYVLDGRIRYHIEGETFEGLPGASFHVPRGTLENFEPVEESRLLVTYTPGGIEGFFAEAGESAPRRELPPPPTEPPDIERLIAIGERHGMRIAPPTPA
jgi:quercetin dioxygenase-like cupin family protein